MNPLILYLLIAYLVIMNLIGFILMGADKRKAKLGKWRIPEKTFFLFSILGGSLGTWTGMYVFRHKTKHWYFVVFMPLIFFAHVAAVILLLIYTR